MYSGIRLYDWNDDMVVKCVVSYDGTNYKGWQVQPNANTIQKQIEETLYQIHHCTRVEAVASGRTDTHVHALGQVFHFITDLNLSEKDWKFKLNRLLPKDIRIREVTFETDDFHARFSCTSKRYDYLICTNGDDPFVRNYMYVEKRKLDLERMTQAAHVFEGCHDFTSFTSSKIHEEKSRVRTITECSVHEEENCIRMIFKGDGFLRYQVRMMAQTIIEVGLNHLEVNDVKEMLEATDKHVCRYKAEAKGLYLVEVNYD